MSDFTAQTDGDGVTTITWDVPGRSMNVMTEASLADLGALMDAAFADGAVRGVILTSGKAGFAGGMDLSVIAGMKDRGGAQGVFDGLMGVHAILRRIERAGMDPKTLKGGKPVAAALPGTALGLGLELPLACHRIFAADDARARIGLPEIRVGIFPGAGGTTRLVRKLGVMAAAPLLLEGKLNDPRAAKAAGVVDEVVAPGDLLARAKDWVLGAGDADLVKPWDAKGYKMPGGTPYSPQGFMTFAGAPAMVMGRTFGVYPAARALLSAAYEGALVPFDTALRIEARWFTSVLIEPTSSAMIRTLFVNKEALEKGALRPALPEARVRRLGVIGAGMMGAGIAYVAADAGIEVVLVDATQAGADKGRDWSAGTLDAAVARRKATPDHRDAVLGRITATDDVGALAGCDLVVEAVFEDPAVKADVTRRVEAVLGADAIFATNTSTLPISGLAEASVRPAQFLGIHFFSPVDRMALVEIIRGAETGDPAVAKAIDFVRQLRKTPIVVSDARFFYANRCIIPYINEGIRMVAEGVSPVLVENAARLAGMPVGPLQLVDETSIELGLRIATAAKAALGDAYADDAVDAVLQRLAGEGRLGRKAKAGFYAYDEAGKRAGLWPGLGEAYPVAPAQPDVVDVQQRLLMAQALEAVRALEEGVLHDIREGDVGAVLGWGFAPWSGGPFAWLDRIGAGEAVAICDRLEAAHGARFAAPALLRDMAAVGDGFYARLAPARTAA